MRTNFTIPAATTKYLLYQRTEYQLLASLRTTKRISRLLPVMNAHRWVSLEAKLRGRAIRSQYLADMAAEYETFALFLPEECAAVLDVGCGVAGVDLFVLRHYAPAPPMLALLDKSLISDDVYYLFEDQAAFYNSLEVASDLLTSNGFDPDRIHTYEASNANEIGVMGDLDLVLSLISWGFHYPVETYRDQVFSALRPGGRLILDVRHDTGGIESLEAVFGSIEVIVETAKYDRVCATKK